MWRTAWIVSLAVLTVSAMGCGGSDQASQASATGGNDAQSAAAAGGNATADAAAPAAAVFDFLEAVRTGNDAKAATMLTQLARRKTAEFELEVAPPGSDTAQFKVGEVEFLAEDGARVVSTWSDLDEKSQRLSEQIVWMVRREPEGWRIAGVAATVFKGDLPVLLNFEDPEEMLRKLEWIQQEKQRRAQQGTRQAQGTEEPDSSIRR